MNLKSNFILWFLLISSCISAFSQGYEINVSINSRNDTVVLGHYFAERERLRANNTVVLNSAGQGTFRGDEKLPNGMYFLVMNGQRLLDFLIGDEQTFDIQINTDDWENISITGSRDNEIFLEFQQMQRATGRQQHELQQRLQTADSVSRVEIFSDLQALNMRHAGEIWKMIEESKGLFVHSYLNAQFPVFMRVPALDPHPWQVALPEEAANWTREYLNQYLNRWYRKNFFSDVNIFDRSMLRTPFYEDKLMDYFQQNNVFIFHPDTVNKEIDMILTRVKDYDDVFRFVLVTLFNHYRQSEFIVAENIWVHIADEWYIPYAHWSADEFTETLKSEVAKRKPNLIGKMAPPMEMLMILPPEHFRAAALDTAIKFDYHAGRMIDDFRRENELRSKYTALYFWDFNCGHCRQGIRDLFDAWEELKDSGLQVITIQLRLTERQDKGRWIDFVNEHSLFGAGWVNAWSPYDHKFRDYYNTENVPVMYLLGEDKTIMLKNIVAEQLKDIVR